MRLSILIFLFMMSATNAQNQGKKILPPKLNPGDTVAIVATARKNITDNLKPAIKLLESWGLKVKIGSSIGLEYNQLAGTDQQRAADLQEQFDNPNIKAVWCVRGGYGTVRIIDKIDFTAFKKNPKWLIGFSDVTVLHNHLNNLGFASIHGLMPLNVATASPAAVESLRKCLFGQPLQYEIPTDSESQLGAAEGEFVGGNLSILYSLLGSDSQVHCDDKILFLEDLDEYLYHIDRMLMNLKRCGCLSKLKGVVVGGMTKMKDNEIPWGKNANQIVAEHLEGLNIPVVFDFPAGHIPDNRALVLGTHAKLTVTKDKTVLLFD